MAGRIRDAFLAAAHAVKDQLRLSQIQEALRTNDAVRAIALLDIDRRFSEALGGGGLPAGIQSVREATQSIYGAAARQAMLELPTTVGVRLSFDLLNPESVAFLRGYNFSLIQQVTNETIDAIRQIIIRGFEEGRAPVVMARDIQQIIGLTARMEKAVANFRLGLESGSASGLRDALSRALRDGRFDRSIASALQEGRGLNQAQIDKMVGRYRERMLQHRARNIARSESVRAANAGSLSVWKSAVDKGLIPRTAKRKWIVSGDDATCFRCLELEDVQAGLDEPFHQGGEEVMHPPLHPSCRCTTALVASSLKARIAA